MDNEFVTFGVSHFSTVWLICATTVELQITVSVMRARRVALTRCARCAIHHYYLVKEVDVVREAPWAKL
jgi:hypothetical protein